MALAKRGVKACGYKPLLCGERTDAHALYQSSHKSEGITLDDINPVWLRPPAAPFTASMIEERPIDLNVVFAGFEKLRAHFDCILVEGVGGWRVPIRQDYFLSDLATQFALPLLVVTRPQLGTLNHTLLTIESIRKTHLSIAGLIINQSSPEIDIISANTNPPMLEELTDLPVLARIDYGQTQPALDDLLRVILSGLDES